MRIVGASGPTISSASAARRSAGGWHEAQPPETDARALIAVDPAVANERSPQITQRPASAFLAHLIATQMQAPQTRARRRAEPEEAMAAYSAMVAARPLVSGRSFGRTS